MAKYISKYSSLKLINKASYTKEVDGRIVVVPGKYIQFTDGIYETKDKDEISFLENHPNFGSVFVRIDTPEVEEAKKKFTQTLEEKEVEEAKRKEEEEKARIKASEEGEEIPRKRSKKEAKKKSKVDKPVF